MPSFNTMISALAAVAFASLSFAAPAAVGGVALSTPIDHTPNGAAGSFHAILTNLATNIKSPADQITAPGFSVDKFAPLAKELTSHLEKAITDAQGLKGSPIETILGAADITTVTALLASIIATVLTALSAVSALASGAGSVAAIAALIAQVSALIATLLATALSLLGALALSSVLGLLLGLGGGLPGLGGALPGLGGALPGLGGALPGL